MLKRLPLSCLLCLAVMLPALLVPSAVAAQVAVEPMLEVAAWALTTGTKQTAAQVLAVPIPVPEPVPEPERASAAEPKEPPVLERFLPILARNRYCVGWLSIDGTAIDDPVLYTPADQNFFLYRDLDGTDASAGTLFLAIPWREGNNAALIYGHNLQSGQRFGGLTRFADAGYGLSHSALHFDTLHGEHTYQLLGAFYSKIYETADIESGDDRTELDASQGAWSSLEDLDLTAPYPDYDIYRDRKDVDDGKFRYYWFTDLSDRKDFDRYTAQVKAASLYDTGTEAHWGDRLLTLSTCAYHTSNGRFAVVWVEKDGV